jgi:paraquat-inducible protein A
MVQPPERGLTLRTRDNGRRRLILSLVIIAASVCLALGISLPTLKLTRLFVFTADYSLISMVSALLSTGQAFLGTTVLLFAIVLPALKLAYLVLVSSLPAHDIARSHRQLRALEWLGRWSMHDVLVLSLAIFFIKSQGGWDARSFNGAYFFSASVLLTMLAYLWLPAEATNGQVRIEDAERPPATLLRHVILSLLIILSAVFFALGLTLPVIRFTTVYVWTKEHSIATIIWALYRNSEQLLCLVVFTVSVFFPFLKLFYLLTMLISPDLSPAFRRRSLQVMEWLGRYSMTDMMVLALLVVYVNASGYTEASVLPGAYFFAASALMTMLAYGWANSAPRSQRA